jgi:hypothetical protein
VARGFVVFPCAFFLACAEGVADAPDDTKGPVPQGPPASDASGPGSGDAGVPDAAVDAAADAQDASAPDGDPGPGLDAAPPDAGPTACQTSLAGARFDFESGPQGWTHDVMDDAESAAPGWPFDSWGQGTATNTPGCKSGACFATTPTQNYVQCGRAELRSPAIDLSKCASAASVTVTFQHAWQFWTGSYGGQTWFDGGVIEISGDGGQTWSAAPGVMTSGTIKINPERGGGFYACVLPNNFYVDGKAGFTGASSSWQTGTIAVPAALRTSQFMVRFAYASGVSSSTSNPDASRASTGPGWHVDDVVVTAQ